MDRSGRLSAETIKFFYRDVKQCLKSSNYDAPNEVFSTYLGGSGSSTVAASSFIRGSRSIIVVRI
jgi:hypothetical protein